jgi:hypothetical protein
MLGWGVPMAAFVLLAQVNCSRFEGDTATTADGGADAAVDAAPDDTGSTSPCASSSYTGDPIIEGYLCGVGACRRLLKGPACVELDGPDGGKQSPCTTAFPDETLGDDKDNNCNGVVDEGRLVASPNAGFECRGCGFGRRVQRLASGALDTEGFPNNRGAYQNNAECVNSDLCKLPSTVKGGTWVRNVRFGPPISPTGDTTCAQLCPSVGGTCKTTCSTKGSSCRAEAQQDNLGTFAADYSCVAPNGTPKPGSVLTGDCDAKFPNVTNTTADFNVYCCCEF